MIHQLGHQGHKKISNKLPIIVTSAVVLIILGLIFMTPSKYKYELSTEEMLEEVLKRNDIVRPEKFMDIYYNNDSLYRFIDLRSAPEFLAGHIEGAIHIPIHKFLNDEYQKILNQDERINVLYYTDQCGACGPWMVLKQLGYKNNKILQGGYSYVNENIIKNYSPMSADFSPEKARYDFSKVIKQTQGAGSASVSENDADVAPIIMKPKTEKVEEEGGC